LLTTQFFNFVDSRLATLRLAGHTNDYRNTDKLIEEMIEEDIIEECPPSRFCLPFLIVKKRVETPEIREKSAKGNQKSKDSTGQKTKEKMGKYCYQQRV